jgi:hypothetical protein
MHIFRSISVCLFLFFTTTYLPAQIMVSSVYLAPGASSLAVLRWNANTGTVMNNVTTTAQGAMSGSSVFDAVNGQYYFRAPSGLQRISFSPDVADVLNVQFDLNIAEIDMQDGKIYGINFAPVLDSSGTNIISWMEFVEYNLSDSTEAGLLLLPDVAGLLADGSAYDSNHGIYYFVGVDTLQQYCLYSVTTASSSYSWSKAVLGNMAFQTASLEYDNDNDVLYALGRGVDTTTNTSSSQIQVINSTTGLMTLEADFPQFTGLLLGGKSYDQASNAMVFAAMDSSLGLWAYNTQLNSLTQLVLPASNIGEIEVDNSEYAAVKYGAVSSLDALASKTELLAFPNPASDRVSLRLPQAHTGAALTVYDVRGKQVAHVKVPAGEASVLDVQAFPAGAYFVQALVDGRMLCAKLVVSR